MYETDKDAVRLSFGLRANSLIKVHEVTRREDLNLHSVHAQGSGDCGLPALSEAEGRIVRLDFWGSGAYKTLDLSSRETQHD